MIQELPVSKLHAGRYQTRQHFDPHYLEELAQSIQQHGIIQPIIVRPDGQGTYEIIAGERRWRAAQIANLTTVPALVRPYSESQAAEITAIENLQRQNLNPIEEAQTYHQLIDEFNYTHEDIAASLGQSRTRITNSLRLLKLDSSVQQHLINGTLSEGHGKMLAGLSALDQIRWADHIQTQALSVRALEKAIKAEKTQQPRTQPNVAIQPLSDPDIKHLEKNAATYLNTEVTLDHNSPSQTGWLKIRYYDHDTLAGILEKIGLPPRRIKYHMTPFGLLVL